MNIHNFSSITIGFYLSLDSRVYKSNNQHPEHVVMARGATPPIVRGLPLADKGETCFVYQLFQRSSRLIFTLYTVPNRARRSSG